jgi:tRNA (guanine37-N1)-methyltransferase
MSAPVSEIKLDRDSFRKELSLVGLKIPKQLCSQYLDKFSGYLLDRAKCKRIFNIENNPDLKLVLLAEKYQEFPSITSTNSIPTELIQFHEQICQQHNVPAPYYQDFKFPINYEDYSADEVLSTLLAGKVEEVPSAFEAIGHVAHVNLRDDVLPYRYLVGQVILDKNKHIKTVVNKVGSIETEFRTFPIEVHLLCSLFLCFLISSFDF